MWYRMFLVIGLIALSVSGCGRGQQVHLRMRAQFLYDVLRCLRQSDVNRQLPSVVRDSMGSDLYSWRLILHREVQLAPVPRADLTKAWTDQPERTTLEREPYFCGRAPPRCAVWAVVGESTVWKDEQYNFNSAKAEKVIALLGVENSDQNWMAPGDVSLQALQDPGQSHTIGESLKSSEDIILIGFTDGEVWAIKCDVPCSALVRLSKIGGNSQEADLRIAMRYRLWWIDKDGVRRQ